MKCKCCGKDMELWDYAQNPNDRYFECICGATCNYDGSDFMDKDGRMIDDAEKPK